MLDTGVLLNVTHSHAEALYLISVEAQGRSTHRAAVKMVGTLALHA